MKTNNYICASQGGGATQKFSCKRRLFFWGGGQYFGFFSEKMNYFGGMKSLWTYIGGHRKTGLFLEVISMHFMVFFTVKVQNGKLFL